jgi:hydrogenase nickel incorporation protein HypA/HybF
MHEASLVSGLMQRIGDIAAAEGARRITGVSVWLGALSHLSAEHFAEHFNQAASGTLAEGALLHVTLSEDERHEHAQDVLLESVEVDAP